MMHRRPKRRAAYAGLMLVLTVASVSYAGDVALARGAMPEWHEWTHPGDRTLHAVAVDEQRGRMVLFGGRNSTSYPTTTYEWDGERWFLAATDGPGARDGLAMAYDSVRKSVLMFGGKDLNSSGFFGDTWRWDGATWSQVAQTGPVPRERHAMAFDRARGEVLLFGGTTVDEENGVVVLGDTWRWNGAAWNQVDDSGPVPRSDARMVHDSARDRVVLYGGQDGKGNVLGDTWEWNGSGWSPVAGDGPPCRVGHAMSFDAARERVVLFGGAAPCVNFPFFADQQDTWEWDGEAWTRLANEGPFKRRYATLAYDAGRERTVLFGGWPAGFFPVGDGGSSLESDLPLGDLWEWDGAQWAQRMSTSPRGRYGHRIAYDDARRVAVLFGGRTTTFGYESETWEWNGQGWTRRQYAPPLEIGPAPRARGHVAMAYDSLRDRVWLFGGAQSSGNALADQWSWDGSAWSEYVPAHAPPGLVSASMAYDAQRDRLVLFGGILDSGPPFGETWEFDGSDWSRISTTGPAPRYESSMAYDDARGRVVLFGGSDGSGYFGDTWEWDGALWVRVAETGPAARQSAAVAYDVDRQRVVIRGGSAGTGPGFVFFDDAWEWNGSSWTTIPAPGPQARAAEAMIYHSARGEMMLFGGTDDYGDCRPGCGSAETWRLRTSAAAGRVFEDGFEGKF